ncbi:ABC transporter permease [Fusibacter bizertensis]
MKRNLYALTIITLTWYLLHFFVNPRLIPAPHSAIILMVHEFPLIMHHALLSLYRILVAIFATLLIGVPLGILIAMHPRIDRLLSPIIYALYPVPKIAFLPLLMLFFGLGDLSKIILVGLIIIFQILVSTRDGVKAINQSYFTSMRTLRATKKQVYQHLIIPAIVPNLLTSLRVSIGTSISVLFFAENFATRYGIGYFIMDSWLKLDYTSMFAGIVVISLMGVLLFSSIDLLEKKLCRWQGR